MSNEFECYYDYACEYTIPIKLHVPIFLEPHVMIKEQPICPPSYKIPVNLEPEVYLNPEVKASHPHCLPQNGHHNGHYHRDELPASEGV